MICGDDLGTINRTALAAHMVDKHQDLFRPVMADETKEGIEGLRCFCGEVRNDDLAINNHLVAKDPRLHYIRWALGVK